MITLNNLEKTFFTDESIFTVEGRYNAHNDVFYARERRKDDVDEIPLSPKSVMVSGGVSKLGKTTL